MTKDQLIENCKEVYRELDSSFQNLSIKIQEPNWGILLKQQLDEIRQWLGFMRNKFYLPWKEWYAIRPIEFWRNCQLTNSNLPEYKKLRKLEREFIKMANSTIPLWIKKDRNSVK